MSHYYYKSWKLALFKYTFYISNIICMYNFLKIYILDFKYTDMYKWRHFAAVCEMIIHDI